MDRPAAIIIAQVPELGRHQEHDQRDHGYSEPGDHHPRWHPLQPLGACCSNSNDEEENVGRERAEAQIGNRRVHGKDKAQQEGARTHSQRRHEQRSMAWKRPDRFRVGPGPG